MEAGLRVGKAFLVAILTLGSVWFLTDSALAGALAALVPLVLGSLGLWSNIVYGLAGLIFIAAVVVYVAGEAWGSEGLRFAQQISKGMQRQALTQAREAPPTDGDAPVATFPSRE